MLDTSDLHLFVRVAELQSLSRGAAAAGRPKSSASWHIARLERQLGEPLLERLPRSVRLTDAGRILYKHAVALLEALDAAEAAISQSHGVAHGTLRINAPHLFATRFLAPRLPEFARGHPGITLVVDASSTPQGESATEADVTIRVGPLEDSSLVAKKLGDSELRLFAAPSVLAAYPSSLRARIEEQGVFEAAELGAYRQIIWFDESLAERRMEIHEPTARYATVLAGGGLAWLPAFLCRDDEIAGRLVNACDHESRGPVTIHALFTSHGGATPKVRAFLAFLSQAMIPLSRPWHIRERPAPP